LQKNPTDNFSFYLGRRITNLFLNILCGSRLTDYWTCYKVFKAPIVKSLKLECNRFDVEVEMTVKIIKGGYKIVEVPIDYLPRSISAGKKIKPQDGLIAIWKTIKYKFFS